MMRYEINGKAYLQKPLVLGQIGQLAQILQGVVVPEEFLPLDMVGILGDRLNRAVAVVLREEGKPLKDKDIAALTAELDENIDALTQMDVVKDFFTCNPVALLLERLTGMAQEIAEKMATGSEKSSAFSQRETSPEGTISSGDTPLTSADPI